MESNAEAAKQCGVAGVTDRLPARVGANGELEPDNRDQPRQLDNGDVLGQAALDTAYGCRRRARGSTGLGHTQSAIHARCADLESELAGNQTAALRPNVEAPSPSRHAPQVAPDRFPRLIRPPEGPA